MSRSRSMLIRRPPQAALASRDLTSSAKLVLVALVTYLPLSAKKAPVCFPALATLMADTGLSRATVSRAIKDLREHGWIDRVWQGKPSRSTRVCLARQPAEPGDVVAHGRDARVLAREHLTPHREEEGICILEHVGQASTTNGVSPPYGAVSSLAGEHRAAGPSAVEVRAEVEQMLAALEGGVD